MTGSVPQRRPWAKQSQSSEQHRIRGRKGVALRHQVRVEEPFCRICEAKGVYTLSTEIDHIVPLAKGGTNDRSNLQALCAQCHEAKSLRDRGARPKQALDADGWPVRDESANYGR